MFLRLKAEKDRANSDSEELKNTKLELEEIKKELRRKNIECKDNEDELIKNKLELEQVNLIDLLVVWFLISFILNKLI